MAMIVLSIVMEGTKAKVDSLMTDKTIAARILRAELRKLLKLLTEIRYGDVLEKKYIGTSNFSYWLKNLKKLKNVAFKAQDVIDELAYEILHPKVTDLNSLKNNVKLAYKVRILNHSLNKIKNKMGLGLDYVFKRIPDADFDRITNPVLDNPIIGREADASKIVNLLTRSSDQRVLTVVPVVGMAGLGKTALAKLVSQQVMALNLFDVKIWVCVSGKCDEQQILGQMLQSLNASMWGLNLLTKIDAIFQQLEKELEGKRFLLVLDDVCVDVSRWWDDFRTRFFKICRNNGNVVLVTTRSEQVASIVETSSQHEHTLGFLSDDGCWSILKNMALRSVPAHSLVLSNLETIGREIAKKCRGVPLAAKVLGGTLGFNRDEGGWLKIRDSRVFDARDNAENLKSILKLSFDQIEAMFYALKPCFVLCSVFPKGFLITKEDLFLLWMGEGFVDSCGKGKKYFDALLAISFFQDLERDDDGNVIKCKMHNLVHDLASSLEKSERRIHYLCAVSESIRTSKVLLKNKANYLSTIILNGALFERSWNPKSLRTLYLNDVDMKILPSSISKSKHFKYLHVSYMKISPLPESITHMYMLQILTLSNCSCEELPLLGDLPFLKILKISHMERVKCIGNESYGFDSEGNSSQHELRLFPALQSLSLSWMENLIDWSRPSHGKSVVIFPCLQNLSIQCCSKLTCFPMRDLSALVKIEIKDCEELRFVFGEQMFFPSITNLSVIGCPKLTYLRNWLLSNESYNEFRVRRCAWLKFIPDNLGMQTFLVSLQIYCCNALGSFSEEILCKLTQLRKLSIGAFSEKLDDFCYLNRIEDLRRLEELEIWGSDVFGRKMSALPNQLKHLASLRSLKIKGFTSMEALPEWLGTLQYLETISLNYCWHLKHQSTVAITQRLFNLSHVHIHSCPALEEHKSQWKEFTGTTKISILFQ